MVGDGEVGVDRYFNGLLAHLALSVPRGAPCAELLLQLSAIDEMLGFDEKISGQAIAIAQAGAG
jgi:hypothetical protein